MYDVRTHMGEWEPFGYSGQIDLFARKFTHIKTLVPISLTVLTEFGKGRCAPPTSCTSMGMYAL